MLADRNGNVRYFTVREMARLQCFPDDFIVTGSWKAQLASWETPFPPPLARAWAGDNQIAAA
jgi:site-specific DNA-cytosine methylase